VIARFGFEKVIEVMEDLGRKLQEARVEKGLSVSELSDRTKIREHYIIDIEKGDMSTVSPVYAKSFVESIAKTLGLEESEYRTTLDSYVAKLRASKPKTQPKHNESIKNSIRGSDKSFRDNMNPRNIRGAFTKENAKKIFVILLGLLGLVVVYIVYFDSDMDNVADPILTDSTTVSDTTYIDVDAGSDDEEDEGILSGMFSGGRDSIELVATAIDSSWVKIVMDGQRADEKLIVPGEKIIWRAKKEFVITQGNVGALEIRRNGKLLEPFGAKGTVVKGVKITENEVKLP
jgi:transcriptional regulator with XRE-family HTH domain